MEQNSGIQLSSSCIISVPLQTYNNDFTFIVNGKEFQTSRIISDLLSPKICKIHMIDPTIDTFTINTVQQGNFSYILDLVSFTLKSIPTTELPFVSEVIEILENEMISLNQSEKQQVLAEDYIQNRIFCTLYETVYFERVSSENISEFVDIFNINDITNSTWIRLANRLKQDTKEIGFIEGSRYKKKKVSSSPSQETTNSMESSTI